MEPEQQPEITPPAYNKPDAPGVAMNFDNTVSIYQVVGPEDTFESAANEAFALLIEAQKRFPDWPRVYYLDISGQEGEREGFNADFFEFQQEFAFSTIAHFLTALDMPLASVLNPNPQRNDLPDQLAIK